MRPLALSSVHNFIGKQTSLHLDTRNQVFASRQLTPKSDLLRIEGCAQYCNHRAETVACTSTLHGYFLDEVESKIKATVFVENLIL